MEEIERASARGGAQIGESDKKVKIGKRCKVGKIDKIAKHRWEDMTGHGDSMQKEISGRKPKNMVLQYAHQGARAASIMLRWSMTSQSLRKERMNPEWTQIDAEWWKGPRGSGGPDWFIFEVKVCASISGNISAGPRKSSLLIPRRWSVLPRQFCSWVLLSSKHFALSSFFSLESLKGNSLKFWIESRCRHANRFARKQGAKYEACKRINTLTARFIDSAQPGYLQKVLEAQNMN